MLSPYQTIGHYEKEREQSRPRARLRRISTGQHSVTFSIPGTPPLLSPLASPKEVPTTHQLGRETTCSTILDVKEYESSRQSLELSKAYGSRVSSGLSFGQLAGTLHRAIENTKYDSIEEAGFLSETLLPGLLTEAAIGEELGKIEISLFKRFKEWVETRKTRDVEQEVHLICGHGQFSDNVKRSYLKIFAILLLIDRPAAIRKFITDAVNCRGVSDKDLPLVKVPVKGKTGLFKLRTADRRERTLKPTCFSGWSIATLDAFERWQWKVLAHSFDGKRKPHDTNVIKHSQTVLPFTFMRNQYEHKSTTVYKVKIHKDHHRFPDPDGYFCVKRVGSLKTTHNQELQMIRRTNHRHVTPLLATYHYRECYHFIMPWAECDLNIYWEKRYPEHMRDKETLTWMMQQCAGIAEGLQDIHLYETTVWSTLNVERSSNPKPEPRMKGSGMFYGVHGDIKPSNLLWFPNCNEEGQTKGTIKLADFGSGNFSTTMKIMRTSGSFGFTATYSPPECSFTDDDVEMSAEYDVWSLGCLFLEFVTWYIGGWNAVVEFKKQRGYNVFGEQDRDATFYEPDPCDYGNYGLKRVKKAVKDHIANLRASPYSSISVNHFLTLMEEEMLIVHSPCSDSVGLRPVTRRRRSSGIVANQLMNMAVGGDDTDEDD
ncbi:kinase-like domain-containing protein [Xylaria cf. heliscus]|nr:kinase-like domain-containing protein [Xylaria cf. heliscus]